MVKYHSGSLFLISCCGLSQKVKNTFLIWEKQTWYWEKRWLFSIGNGAEIRPLEKGRICFAAYAHYLFKYLPAGGGIIIC